MRQLSTITLTALLVFFSGLQANASILLEPSVGYESSTLTTTYKTGFTGTDYSAKQTMLSLGARLGYKATAGFWVGLDIVMGLSGTYKPNDTTQADGTLKQTSYGVGLGYDFPMGLRLYGIYNLKNELSLDQTTAGVTSTSKTSGGTSYRIGVGYKFVPQFALNAEYLTYTQEKLENATGTTTLKDFFDKWSATGFRVVASFPFAF